MMMLNGFYTASGTQDIHLDILLISVLPKHLQELLHLSQPLWFSSTLRPSLLQLRETRYIVQMVTAERCLELVRREARRASRINARDAVSKQLCKQLKPLEHESNVMPIRSQRFMLNTPHLPPCRFMIPLHPNHRRRVNLCLNLLSRILSAGHLPNRWAAPGLLNMTLP
jgi:hypothetical protein